MSLCLPNVENDRHLRRAVKQCRDTTDHGELEATLREDPQQPLVLLGWTATAHR